MMMPAPDNNYEPSYPRITLMASDSIDGGNTPIRWSVGDAHPFIQKMKIVAMYLNENVVEIYSFNGTNVGIRELIPFTSTKFVREEMPPDVFGEELRHAEMGYPEDDPDDDPDDDPEPEPMPPPEPVPANGQPVP